MKGMIQMPMKSVVPFYLGRQFSINSGHECKTDVKVKWELVLSCADILVSLNPMSMNSSTVPKYLHD